MTQINLRYLIYLYKKFTLWLREAVRPKPFGGVISASEYDASYFDGESQPYKNNAGYSRYERWYRREGPNSTGEFWKDYAQHWINHLTLPQKKVLEIGCAKGFLVKDLRDAGVDAYGLDVSSYAIGACEPEVAPYLTVGDARTALAQYKRNEFDVLISLRFLECIPEADLPALITEMNRISRLQVHVVDQFTGVKSGAGQYYLQKTLDEWTALPFATGTRIIAQENLDDIRTK